MVSQKAVKINLRTFIMLFSTFRSLQWIIFFFVQNYDYSGFSPGFLSQHFHWTRCFSFWSHKPLIKLETINWGALKWFSNPIAKLQVKCSNGFCSIVTRSPLFCFRSAQVNRKRVFSFVWFGKNSLMIIDQSSKWIKNKNRNYFLTFFSDLERAATECMVDTSEPSIRRVYSRRWLIDAEHKVWNVWAFFASPPSSLLSLSV